MDDILPTGDRYPRWCGLGRSCEVPYMEALAFWGRQVELGLVPRSYALGVLVDHPFLEHGWEGGPPSRWDRLCAAADDLGDWENLIVKADDEGERTFGQYLEGITELEHRMRMLPLEVFLLDQSTEVDPLDN